MRIAMFTNNYLPRISGPAFAIESLRQNLINLNHTVFVFAPKYKNQLKNEHNIIRIPSIRIPVDFFYPLPLPHFSNIDEIFKKQPFDIIHSHHPIMLGKIAQKLSQKYNIPLVFSYHSQWDLYLYKFFPVFPFDQITKIFRNLCNDYLAKADAITVPHDIFKNKFLYIDSKKIFVIPSSINEKLFSLKIPNAKKTLRLKLNLPLKSKIIFCVTRLSFEKNVDFLIEAFSLVSAKNTFLVIAGEGIAKFNLQNLVKSLNLDKKVLFIGKVPHNDLPLFYQGSDIYTQVSNFETQCLALNEAMASGCLIVARESDYLKGVIKDGKNALIAKNNIKDFAFKISAALNQTKKYNYLKKQAKDKAKDYFGKIIARKFEKLYLNLVNK